MDRVADESSQGMTVAFFGHDAADAAIRRRIKSFQDDGVHVDGYMMRRDDAADTAWPNHDLGLTKPGAFIHRALSVFTGTGRALRYREQLQAANVFYARNLDMLAIAVRVKNRLKLDVPIIYECLDVHRLLCRSDLVGKVFRNLEGKLLRASSALVVSSPAFLEQHFDKHYPGDFRATLVENRLTDAFTGGNRPQTAPSDRENTVTDPLRLGWVGVLRCQRSLNLLCETAERLGPKVAIRLHGIPAETEIPNFHEQISKYENISFFGRYKAPEDLSEIYDKLDVVWAGDFMEAGFNSVWLLPNRIYEGGYFATPAICPAETQTATWVSDYACGFVLQEPLESSFTSLIENIGQNREQISNYVRALRELPDEVFVQPAGFLRALLEDVSVEHNREHPVQPAANLRPV